MGCGCSSSAEGVHPSVDPASVCAPLATVPPSATSVVIVFHNSHASAPLSREPPASFMHNNTHHRGHSPSRQPNTTVDTPLRTTDSGSGDGSSEVSADQNFVCPSSCDDRCCGKHVPDEDEELPAPAKNFVDCWDAPSHFDVSVRSSGSLSLRRDNTELGAELLFHPLGDPTGGEMASLFPVMLGNNDKERSLSQCGVLFEGHPAPVEEAARDPLNGCSSRNVLFGSGFGKPLDSINQSGDGSVSQSLVSASHFHRSTAPDSFSAVETTDRRAAPPLGLATFEGFLDKRH